jgi:translocation and assembly module TamB
VDRKHRKKTGIVIFSAHLALVATVAIVAIVLHTTAFHQFVLRKVIEEAHAATGARVEIGDFAFSWRGLRIDFYNVVLRGTEPASQRPLLTAEHLAVGVKILSAWKRQIDLKEIQIDRPVANLQIDSAGGNNLPVPPTKPAKSQASKNIFDLAIQYVNIRDGEIYYNDRELPLSAELHDFRAESSFSNLDQRYKVMASYEQGVLAYQEFKPIVHNLTLSLQANRAGVTVDHVAASTAKSTVVAQGSLSDYAHPVLSGGYSMQIEAGDLAAIVHTTATPAGQLQLNGNIHYQATAGVAFIKGVLIDGKLASQSLMVRAPGAQGELKALRANYRLADGTLTVSEAQADTLGGRVKATYQLAHLDAQPASRLDASAQGITMRATARAFSLRATPEIAQGAKADVKVQALWTSDIQKASARANATVSSADPAHPLDGKLNIAYQGSTSTVTLDNSYLRSSATQLALSGTINSHSNLNVEINASDLHELRTLLSSLQPADGKGGPPVNTANLHGTARFHGQVLGSLQDPRITGELSGSNLTVNDSHWRTLQASLDLNHSEFVLRNGQLRGQRQGELRASGRVELLSWSFTDTSSINVQAIATKLSVEEIQTLAGQHYPVTGTLDGSVSLAGSKNNPSGRGSISLTQATAWNESIKTFAIDFKGDGASLQSRIQLQIPAGNATGNLNYSPKSGEYDGELSSPGLKLEQINAIQSREAGLAGILNLSAKAHGTLQNPSLNADISVTNLKVRGQSVSDLQANVQVANQHAKAMLKARLEQVSIDAQGDLDLRGDHLVNARVDTGKIPIGFLLANYAPSASSDLQGQTEFHATVSGPLRDPSRLQAHLEIPTLQLKYQSQQIANARPLRFNYAGGLIKIEDAEFTGSGTNLKIAGAIPTRRDLSMDVNLNGALDLTILKAFQHDLDSSGTVNAQIVARGTLSNPQIQGQAKIINAAVTSGTVPIGFENLNGAFNIAGNRVDIQNFSANAGGGKVTATGFFTYGGNSDFSFNLDANNVRVRYPDGVRSIVGGSLQMNGSPGASTLSGKVVIDRLSFTKDFDLANFMAQFSGDAPAVAPSAFEQNMKLNIAVQTANNLNAVSSKLSIEGAANLTVGGTAADPVILGRTTLTSGDIFFLGKRYEVQSGTIEFANSARTQPTLNLYVTTTVQQYNITLNFVGPLERLRTNYTSDPSLPPSDIINLIAFGKTAAASASAAGTPTSVGAESVLAQGVSGQVSGSLEKLAGISQLSIDPLAGTNPNDPGSQISVQQRVSGNLLLTFSTDVTSTQNQAVQLQYNVKRNVSVSALRDQNGGYAVDVRIRKDF